MDTLTKIILVVFAVLLGSGWIVYFLSDRDERFANEIGSKKRRPPEPCAKTKEVEIEGG